MSEDPPLARRIADGEFDELDPREFDSMKDYAAAESELEGRFRHAVMEELGLAELDHADDIYRTGRAIVGNDRMAVLQCLGHLKRLFVEMDLVEARRHI